MSDRAGKKDLEDPLFISRAKLLHAWVNYPMVVWYNIDKVSGEDLREKWRFLVYNIVNEQDWWLNEDVEYVSWEYLESMVEVVL